VGVESRGSSPKSGGDPIGYFLQDMIYHGRSDRTQAAYERVLRAFEAFLADRDTVGGELAPTEASQRECMAWVHSLREAHSRSTVATYASYLHRFYRYMTQTGVFDSNPMELVVSEMDETIEKNPSRREITLPAMRAFVQDIDHPLDRAVILTLLKTGMRVGECCNLDIRDCSLTEAWASETYDLGTRAGLDNRPDSLLVGSDVTRSESTNGEERSASNKRKRTTVIPIDDELKRVLVRWLAIRPDARSPAEPLFCSTGSEWGERLTPPMARKIVEEYARAAGWYRSNGGAEENVTPHYFRHFFTTHLRDRTGDRGVVKYLRGDVAEDVIDTYTHNWGDRVREVYEANIYQLL
jgi:integrase